MLISRHQYDLTLTPEKVENAAQFIYRRDLCPSLFQVSVKNCFKLNLRNNRQNFIYYMQKFHILYLDIIISRGEYNEKICCGDLDLRDCDSHHHR